MKISAIDTTVHRLPLDPPVVVFWDSKPRETFEITLVRVRTDDGLEGIAAGEAMDGFAAYANLFVGRDPLDIDRHHAVLDNICFHGGRYWPVDIALWDLRGKIEGQPIYRLLGGSEGRVRAYASTALRRDRAQSEDLARGLVESGFAAIKLRFSADDRRQDIERAAVVRAAIGDDVALMVDCNQGWRMPWDTAPPWNLAIAREVAAALGEIGVYWMEEPLHRGDYAAMATLRAETTFHIAGGEMTREAHEFHTLIERGCLDVLQPDCALTGGITGLAKIAVRAHQENLVFTPHTWAAD